MGFEVKEAEVSIARYASFIWDKFPTNCDAQLT